MTRTALLVAHPGRPEAVVAAQEAARELERVGFAVRTADGTSTADSQRDLDATDLGQGDVVVVLGGDGTILRAAELARGTDAAVLGVNLGHVGFLAEAERDGIRATAERLAAEDYEVEERRTLTVTTVTPGGEPVVDWALNEAAVEKAEHGRMVEVVLEVDGRPLSSFGCDGVLFATATGSTAHAFSAGGPVVWPDVDAVLCVPVSAHSLFARPLVVGPSSVLALEILDRSTAAGALTCDGRRGRDLPLGSRVEVRFSDVPVRLARLGRAPFTDRLVHKFALPVEGWRGQSVLPPAPTTGLPLPGAGEG